MLKPSFLCSLIGILAIAGSASAQTTAKNKPNARYAQRQHYGRNVVNDILRKQGASVEAAERSGARTTAVLAERVVAYSEYDYNPVDSSIYYLGKIDSGSFIYHGSQRGSQFNKSSMGYYSAQSYFSNSSFLSGYNFLGYSQYPFQNYSFAVDIMCDTSYYWAPMLLLLDSTGHAPYYFMNIHSNTYDASNNVVNYQDNYYPDMPGEISKVINTYNASGGLATSMDFSWGGTSWDTNTISYFIYNSNGKLILDSNLLYSSPGWYPQEKWCYYYNASGDLYYLNNYWDSGTVWVEQHRQHMIYNPDHTLYVDSFSDGGGTFWEGTETDTFGYTPGVSYYTYISSGTPVSAGSYNRVILEKHVAASGLPDSLYMSSYASSPHAYSKWKAGYTYDSYNNPTVGTSFNFVFLDTTTGTGYYDPAPIGKIFYYYETYMSIAGVKDVPGATEKITVYPNPATSQITISRPDAAKGSHTVIRLMNQLGQTLRTESMPWMNTSETVSLAGIAPGIYVVSIEDKSGKQLHVEKIVKL